MMYACLVPHPPLIVPGVGRGDEIPSTRRACEKIASELDKLQPDTVVVISPHSVMYGDYIHIAPGKSGSGDFSDFGAAGVKISVDYDAELAKLIGEIASVRGIPSGAMGAESPRLDHGVMVPLYFLKPKRIVRVSISGLPLIEHYRFGQCVTAAARKMERKIAVVASGDMSHKLKEDGPYGFAPEGPEHDKFVCDHIAEADFRGLMLIDPELRERAAECGVRSLAVMLGALDGMRVESHLLAYEAPYGVGYLTAAFMVGGEAPSLLPQILKDKQDMLEITRSKEDAFARLARQSTEHFVRTGKSLDMPSDLPAEMLARRAGVFVSIKKDGQLRGCTGTTGPTQKSIAAEIIKNSVASASRDNRFSPVATEELDDLTYSVDVLSKPEPVSALDSLDVRRYGVIVTHAYKRGLLLPDLDGIDTVESQIKIALQKAGIGRGEQYSVERFEVERHK